MTIQTSALEDLRTRAVAGDANALNALCTFLAPPVFRLCLRMLGHIGDAEDVAQDVLVKVVTHLSQFDGRSSLMTWVHTIAVRHVLATKKSRAELRALDEASFAALLEQGLAYGASQSERDPEERTLVREVRLSCTQGMLLVLSREERLAIVLVDLLGLDGAEAAVVAETSHDAFRQRLARARAKLGEFLGAQCGLVSSQASCRCEKQVAAKKAVGMKLRLLPLCTNEHLPASSELHGGDDVRAAQAELRSLRAIADAFHRDGVFDAPATLYAKITALLPSVL